MSDGSAPQGEGGAEHASEQGDVGGSGSGERSLLEDLVDYGLYAPLGAAIRVAQGIPDFVDKGRTRVEGRISTARLVGRFAVKEARRRVEQAITPPPAAPAEESSPDAGRGSFGGSEGVGTDPDAPGAGAGAGATSNTGDPARTAMEGPTSPTVKAGAGHAGSARNEQERPVAAATPVPGAPAVGYPAVEDLAIPNYDSLAASQVVPRLAGLSAGELEAVRRYESARRRRRTVLNRIAQLQDGPAGAKG